MPFEFEIRIRLNMREGGWGRSLYVGEFCVKWVNFISLGGGGGGIVSWGEFVSASQLLS